MFINPPSCHFLSPSFTITIFSIPHSTESVTTNALCVCFPLPSKLYLDDYMFGALSWKHCNILCMERLEKTLLKDEHVFCALSKTLRPPSGYAISLCVRKADIDLSLMCGWLVYKTPPVLALFFLDNSILSFIFENR